MLSSTVAIIIKNTFLRHSISFGFLALKSSLPDRYLGFKECQDEVMRYLVEVEGWDAMDKLCSRLMTHLDKAGEKFRAVNGIYKLTDLHPFMKTSVLTERI